MNIDQIKKIKLQEFLATIDCKPVKQYGVNWKSHTNLTHPGKVF